MIVYVDKFAKLRQKKSLYIHVVVLLTSLPSLDGKLELFVTKKWQKRLPNSSQTDYKLSSKLYLKQSLFDKKINKNFLMTYD